MNEKMLKIFGGVIAGFIVLILVLLLISSCSKRTYTFERLEEEMERVAKKYFEKDDTRLPQEEGDEKIYTLKSMIKNGQIEGLDKLFNDPKLKCEGEVSVLNSNGNYVYSTYLDCGDKYKTEYLKDVIIKDTLVTTGIGLYKENDKYVMKGEVKNNYLSILGKMYRIISIDEKGNIRLIEEEASNNVVWDNRYNSELNKNTGFNQYVLPNNIDSRIKEKLQVYYDNSKNFPDEMKQYVVLQDVCVGGRTPEDVSKDGSTECKVKVEKQHVSTIAAYEFLAASLDQNCNRTDARACKNFNWLTKLGNKAWTVTPYEGTDSKAYTFDFNIMDDDCNSTNTLYAVINIYSKVKYVSGNGTSQDPYKFLEYKEKK